MKWLAKVNSLSRPFALLNFNIWEIVAYFMYNNGYVLRYFFVRSFFLFFPNFI